MPQFCAPGALLIWSRGRDRDDADDQVRSRLSAAGFAELDHAALAWGSRPALGEARYEGPPVALVPDQHLFTFWR